LKFTYVRIFWHKKILVCTQQNEENCKTDKHFNVTTPVKKNEMHMHMADADD